MQAQGCRPAWQGVAAMAQARRQPGVAAMAGRCAGDGEQAGEAMAGVAMGSMRSAGRPASDGPARRAGDGWAGRQAMGGQAMAGEWDSKRRRDGPRSRPGRPRRSSRRDRWPHAGRPADRHGMTGD